MKGLPSKPVFCGLSRSYPPALEMQPLPTLVSCRLRWKVFKRDNAKAKQKNWHIWLKLIHIVCHALGGGFTEYNEDSDKNAAWGWEFLKFGEISMTYVDDPYACVCINVITRFILDVCTIFVVSECEPHNKVAERVLLRLQQKLAGVEDGLHLSLPGQVNHLIHMARDPNNLSRLFPGWQPYI